MSKHEFSAIQTDSIRLNIFGEDTICTGVNESIQISAATVFNEYTYLWSNNSTDPVITVDTAGSYAVTVTDRAGCQEFFTKDIEELRGPDVELIGDPTFCLGDSTFFVTCAVRCHFVHSASFVLSHSP